MSTLQRGQAPEDQRSLRLPHAGDRHAAQSQLFLQPELRRLCVVSELSLTESSRKSSSSSVHRSTSTFSLIPLTLTGFQRWAVTPTARQRVEVDQDDALVDEPSQRLREQPARLLVAVTHRGDQPRRAHHAAGCRQYAVAQRSQSCSILNWQPSRSVAFEPVARQLRATARSQLHRHVVRVIGGPHPHDDPGFQQRQFGADGRVLQKADREARAGTVALDFCSAAVTYSPSTLTLISTPDISPPHRTVGPLRVGWSWFQLA